MTTLVPREPYSQDELNRLYPQDLRLTLVQIFMRHGERSPTSARFRNVGLSKMNTEEHARLNYSQVGLTPYWPYCNAARRMTSAAMTEVDGSAWDDLRWKRHLERLGDHDDQPALVLGPGGEKDGVCIPGELTDKGRQTSLTLGKRLRHLYVDQLGFLPEEIDKADMIYLRATPMQRALDSVQQTFVGVYPPDKRTAGFPGPTIVTRAAKDETLHPNYECCKRLEELASAYGHRTAERWNDTPEMEYLSKLLSKWMPEKAKVAVDSHPRLLGILDTTYATLAHGPATRLPSEFYDERALEIIDKISVEEWYSGFKENVEYRRVGIGALLGDIVARMVDYASKHRLKDLGNVGEGNVTQHPKLALNGCHDTTVGGILSSLGAFEGEKWPPYTSHIALELFQDCAEAVEESSITVQPRPDQAEAKFSWWSSLFPSRSVTNLKPTEGSGRGSLSLRTSMGGLSDQEKQRLENYYVRVRYNDRVMLLPGCGIPGNHKAGDPSMCTLAAFKSIVDKFTPRNWAKECEANLGKSAFPASPEPAGY